MSTILGRKPSTRMSAEMTVVLSHDGAIYVAETKNVSDTGLCIRSVEPIPVGTQLHLVFGQPPELPRLSTEGIVRWSEDGKGLGVELISIRPQDQRALERFISMQSREAQA
jgi:hypothetical protein